jgi:hypothetical protein
LANKETLDKTDEGRRLTFVCEQVHVGHWDAYYVACNLHFVAFGDNAGMNEVPDEELEPKKYATYLENMVTTLSTLGITTATKESLNRNTNSIIRALCIMRKYTHLHDAFIFAESVCCSFSKVESQVPWVLHLHKRVIEKVVMLLFTRSLDKITSDK